jgi:microcystin-dependent protein
MIQITIRADKGSELEHHEVDENFLNLKKPLEIAYIPGELRSFAGLAIPSGWMACEGQLLAVADYPELFAAIGDSYGGDGVVNFALPNYRSGGSVKRIICVGLVPSQPVLQVSVPAAIHGPAPGHYKAGTILPFSVQLLDDVVITGGPISLTIDIGGSSHTLAFVSSTAREWVFADYTVQAGDSGELTATINLNGATLSSGGISAVLTTSSLVNATVDTTAPSAPTVNTLSTTSQTPTITGTATVAAGEVLTVAVNGITYTAGGADLTLSGTNWTLVIPSGNALTTGTYSVTATVTDLAGNSTSDATSAELVIT